MFKIAVRWNSTYSREIGDSPYFMVFGKDYEIPDIWTKPRTRKHWEALKERRRREIKERSPFRISDRLGNNLVSIRSLNGKSLGNVDERQLKLCYSRDGEV